MWLRSWFRERGYDVTLVHNITDVNDKIYDAAPGASAELAERATQLVPRGHRRPRARASRTSSRRRPSTSRRSSASSRSWSIAASPIPPAATSTSASRATRSTARLSGRIDGEGTRNPSEEEERGRAEGGPEGLRALEGRTRRARTRRGTRPWGRGRPGWHIECSAMAEELLGPHFEIHGGGLDLVFPHHENELAQSRALGHDFAQIWTHNGMLRFTGEKMSKSLGNVVTLREAVDTWGRETVLLFFMTAHWSKPIDFSDETMAQAARAGRDVPQQAALAGRAHGDDWEELVAALDDDFNTPDALARPPPLARPRPAASARSGCSGSIRSPAEEPAPAEVRRARRAARGRRGPHATSPSPTGSAARSTRAAGRFATRPAASGSSASSDGRGRLRPSRRARGAARAAAGAGAPRERARDRRRGLAARRAGAARAGRAGAGADGARRHRGSPGRRRPRRAVSVCGRGRAGPRAAAAPRLPRPGHRPAEPRRGRTQRRGRGSDGHRPPRAPFGTRHRRRLPGVGRRGRAPADRGRAQPGAVSRGRQGAGALGLRRRARRPPRRCGAPT